MSCGELNREVMIKLANMTLPQLLEYCDTHVTTDSRELIYELAQRLRESNGNETETTSL